MSYLDNIYFYMSYISVEYINVTTQCIYIFYNKENEIENNKCVYIFYNTIEIN